jgi:hypothetical protein
LARPDRLESMLVIASSDEGRESIQAVGRALVESTYIRMGIEGKHNTNKGAIVCRPGRFHRQRETRERVSAKLSILIV